MIPAWLYLVFAVGLGVAALTLLKKPGQENTFWMCCLFCLTDTAMGVLYLTGVLGNG